MFHELVKDQNTYTVNIKNYIIALSQKINDNNERIDIISFIFSKTEKHKVKYIPYDINWIIKKEFEIVTNSLIKLTLIKITLKNYNFKDYSSICIVEHIDFLYTLLRNGLIAFGCKNPPFIIDISTLNYTSDTVIEIAEQIDKTFLLHTLPINIKKNIFNKI
jgi:hypothetical protein